METGNVVEHGSMAVSSDNSNNPIGGTKIDTYGQIQAPLLSDNNQYLVYQGERLCPLKTYSDDIITIPLIGLTLLGPMISIECTSWKWLGCPTFVVGIPMASPKVSIVILYHLLITFVQ